MVEILGCSLLTALTFSVKVTRLSAKNEDGEKILKIRKERKEC